MDSLQSGIVDAMIEALPIFLRPDEILELTRQVQRVILLTLHFIP